MYLWDSRWFGDHISQDNKNLKKKFDPLVVKTNHSTNRRMIYKFSMLELVMNFLSPSYPTCRATIT